MTPPGIQHPGELRWETRLLAVLAATLTVFGIASLYAAASFQPEGFRWTLQQLSGAAIGAVLLLIASRVDYHRWRAIAWPFLLVSIGLLLIPLLPFTRAIAPVINGSRRWVTLGPARFQPSEVAKLAVVVWAAMLAAKKGEGVRQFKTGVAPFLVMIGLVSLAIMLEPNFSMATVVALSGGIVLFTAGAKIGHFLVLGLGGVLLAVYAVISKPYRWARVRCLLEACGGDADFQIRQSILGFGSGRLWGVGFGEGQQKLNYLPYAYSDFLFSSIGEEWGFVGVLVLVVLYGLFCWMGFRIAKTAPDPFGQYLAAGLTAAIGVTAAMHMAVTIRLMPATGLTLPFMSHGRSSLMVALLSVGVLINIGRMRGRARAAVNGER